MVLFIFFWHGLTKSFGPMTRSYTTKRTLNIYDVLIRMHSLIERESEDWDFFPMSWHPLLYKERERISFSFSNELTPLLYKKS